VETISDRSILQIFTNRHRLILSLLGILTALRDQGLIVNVQISTRLLSARETTLAMMPHDFSQLAENRGRSTGGSRDGLCRWKSRQRARWSYWRMRMRTLEELGSTYGNLISDNRSCRRHKPTWVSEGTRIRQGLLHVERARPAESALTREKDARADGKCCSAGFICRLVVVALPPILSISACRFLSISRSRCGCSR